MFANAALQTNTIWKIEDYFLFKKCADLTISPDLQIIGYNCVFCLGICMELDVFLQHLKEAHKNEINNLYGKEAGNAEMITNSLQTINACSESNYIAIQLNKPSEFAANDFSLVYCSENLSVSNANSIENTCDLLPNAAVAVAPLALDHVLLGGANPLLATDLSAADNANATSTATIKTMAIKHINSYMNKNNSKITANIGQSQGEVVGAAAINQNIEEKEEQTEEEEEIDNKQEEEEEKEDFSVDGDIVSIMQLLNNSTSYTNQIDGGVDGGNTSTVEAATRTTTTTTATITGTISSSSGISDCMSPFTEDSNKVSVK